MRGVILLLIILLVSSIAAAVEIDQEVENLLEENQEVSVIVLLKQDNTPKLKKGLSAQEFDNKIKQRKTAVKAKQEKVLKDIGNQEFELKRKLRDL